jgi:hypothetical protein
MWDSDVWWSGGGVIILGDVNKTFAEGSLLP